MQKAAMNQLANVNNRFQGDARRVLCVCSASVVLNIPDMYPFMDEVLQEAILDQYLQADEDRIVQAFSSQHMPC